MMEHGVGGSEKTISSVLEGRVQSSTAAAAVVPLGGHCCFSAADSVACSTATHSTGTGFQLLGSADSIKEPDLPYFLLSPEYADVGGCCDASAAVVEQMLWSLCPHAFLDEGGNPVVIPDSHSPDLPICPWATPPFHPSEISETISRRRSLTEVINLEEDPLVVLRRCRGVSNVSVEHPQLSSSNAPLGVLTHFTGGSVLSSIFSTTSSILGSGTLSIPFAMRCSGLVLSQLIFFSMLLVNFVGVQLLLRASMIVSRDAFSTSSPTEMHPDVDDVNAYPEGMRRRLRLVANGWSPAAIAPQQSPAAAIAPQQSPAAVSGIIFNNYESLAYRTMGLWGVALVSFAFLGGGLGLLMANTLFIAQCCLAALFGTAPESPQEVRLTVLIVSLLVIFPLCLFKSITAFRFSSFLSFCTLSLVAVLIASRFIVSQVSYGGVAPSVAVGIPEHPDYLTTVSVMVSAFCCHQAVLPIYEKLQRRTVTRMTRVVMLALGSALIIYEVIGICGYFLFGSSTDANILTMLMRLEELRSPRNPRAMVILRLANFFVAVTITASCPMILWPLRSCLISLTKLKNPSPEGMLTPVSYRLWVSTTLIIVILNASMAILFPKVKVALTIVGSVGGSLICFILPPVFWLKAKKGATLQLENLPALTLIFMGLGLGLTSFSHAVLNLCQSQTTKYFSS